ncbi:MAG: hypothetical protein J7647_06375 [Cyanobacteria bacterium SBLK]|nr:hypothetical protein [Cyanobacteria bacterium SBLK]
MGFERSQSTIIGIDVQAADKAIANFSDLPQLPIRETEPYYQNLPFPACVFFFTMDDDLGYYKWLKYPLSDARKRDELEGDRWHSLDNNALAQIVEAIAIWYDAKNHSITEKMDWVLVLQEYSIMINLQI